MRYYEDLWALMLAHVSFSRHDRNFIDNVWANYIALGRPVTPKQGELFIKLVSKYQRQIKQHVPHIDTDTLTWKTSPREVVAQARMWIDNNEILMSFPYNSSVIETWKTFRSRTYNMILSQWEPELLCWHTRATVPAVKQYLDFRKLAKQKHDLDLALDEELTAIDQIFDDSQAELWKVSARPCGDRIVVNHINSTLNELLPESLDTTLENVFKLKNLGVNIDFKILERLMNHEDRTLVDLTGSRRSVLGWSEKNGQAILKYLDLFDLTVFLVVDGANKEYSALAEQIIKSRPENRLHLFIGWAHQK
jgi:hypothetical protein